VPAWSFSLFCRPRHPPPSCQWSSCLHSVIPWPGDYSAAWPWATQACLSGGGSSSGLVYSADPHPPGWRLSQPIEEGKRGQRVRRMSSSGWVRGRRLGRVRD
jgi:hypothetical protein